MYHEKYIFSQLTAFLNQDKFGDLVKKYHGNRYVKKFSCWNQLMVLLFGQISYRDSLGDLVAVVNAHHKKSYHLGFGKSVKLSSLSDANNKRDYRIFEEFAYFMVNEARKYKKVFSLNLKV